MTNDDLDEKLLGILLSHPMAEVTGYSRAGRDFELRIGYHRSSPSGIVSYPDNVVLSKLDVYKMGGLIAKIEDSDKKKRAISNLHEIRKNVNAHEGYGFRRAGARISLWWREFRENYLQN